MEHASDTSGRVILRRLIAKSLARIHPLVDAIAEGSVDQEQIHRLRRVLRELRTAIKELKPFGLDLGLDWDASIAPVFDALGTVRDRQVFLETIAPSLQRAGYRCDVPADALPSIDEGLVSTLVRASPFIDALASLDACSRKKDCEADGLDELPPAGKWLRKRLRRLQRRLRRDGRLFSELAFEQQHAVRKRLKRIQYLSHFVAPRIHRKTDAAWHERADQALAALGRYIDLCQAARAFQAVASPTPQTGFAIGWLRANQDESARASQRLLEDLGRPKRA